MASEVRSYFFIEYIHYSIYKVTETLRLNPNIRVDVSRYIVCILANVRQSGQ